jgi:ATP-dependent Clp protease protease subunit
MNELHLYLFGEVAPNDSEALGITDNVFGSKWLIDSLNANPNAKQVILHINSPGGSVVEGFAMYDVLKGSGREVTTIIEGQCASIATVIFLAGKTRKISRNSTFFIHNPWQQTEGDAEHLRKVADNLELVENIVADFYQEFTNLDKNSLLSYMSQETTFTPEQAVEFGFATEIVEPTTKDLKVQKVKALLNLNEQMAKTLLERVNNAIKAFKDIKAADFSTADGQTITIDSTGEEIAAGDSVSVNGQPAPDGSYTLTDGRTIIVAGGKVTEVKPADAPPAPPAAATPAPAAAAPAPVAATADQVSALADAVKQLAAQFQTLQGEMSSIKNLTTKAEETDKVLETLTGYVELLGENIKSEGFKKVVNKQNFDHEESTTKPKTAEEQKQAAIAAHRAKKMNVKN